MDVSPIRKISFQDLSRAPTKHLPRATAHHASSALAQTHKISSTEYHLQTCKSHQPCHKRSGTYSSLLAAFQKMENSQNDPAHYLQHVHNPSIEVRCCSSGPNKSSVPGQSAWEWGTQTRQSPTAPKPHSSSLPAPHRSRLQLATITAACHRPSFYNRKGSKKGKPRRGQSAMDLETLVSPYVSHTFTQKACSATRSGHGHKLAVHYDAEILQKEVVSG